MPRYAEVIEAYLAGLEELAAGGPQADLSRVPGVTSFFVGRVDPAVDLRLAEIGTPDATGLRGQAGIAQAQLAYQMFRQAFTGPRWEALATRGARMQRPLWASTSVKEPGLAGHPVRRGADRPGQHHHAAAGDDRRGPRSRQARAHGGPGPARRAGRAHRLAGLGIELDEVNAGLENAGVDSFVEAFRALRAVLAAKAGLRT